LRPLPDNWVELVDAGHPMADKWGFEIINLRNSGANVLSFDLWNYIEVAGGVGPGWDFESVEMKKVGKVIRLAPLATRDGRPLHVGDTVISAGQELEITVDEIEKLAQQPDIAWRWPEVKV
jgi:hypothetical protein